MLSQRECFGIDLDSKCRWELFMRYCNLKDAFPNEDIVVYETRHGFHIILPVIKTDLELRRVFGDDFMRIEFEEKRSMHHNRKPQDILFHRKRVMRKCRVVSSYTREVVNVFSEPFYSR